MRHPGIVHEGESVVRPRVASSPPSARALAFESFYALTLRRRPRRRSGPSRTAGGGAIVARRRLLRRESPGGRRSGRGRATDRERALGPSRAGAESAKAVRAAPASRRGRRARADAREEGAASAPRSSWGTRCTPPWWRDTRSDVEVVIVRERAVRLRHHFGGAHAYRIGSSDLLRVREQPRAERGRHKEIAHVRPPIADQRRHERPVPRVVELRAWPARRSTVAQERHEVLGEDRLALLVHDVETEVRIAAALVRGVHVDLAPVAPREMTDRQHRVGELLSHASRCAIDERHQRLQPPPHVLPSRWQGDDPEPRALVEVRATEEMTLRGRTDAGPPAGSAGPAPRS